MWHHPRVQPARRDVPDEREERLRALLERAGRVIRRTLALHDRGADLDDVHGEVLLHLARCFAAHEEESIVSFDDYVATMTFNALHDLLRRRHPERFRLANRLRYHLGQRSDLATWMHGGQLAIGRIEQRSLPPRAALPDGFFAARELRTSVDRAVANGPVLFQPLVTALAAAANLDAVSVVPVEEISIAARTVTTRAEAADLARRLWSEIEQLPARQRCAILLQARDDRGETALLQVLTAGVGPERVAAALGWSREELLAAWPELPFDDARIAALLDATRQQVINLRKSARERLARRMGRW